MKQTNIGFKEENDMTLVEILRQRFIHSLHKFALSTNGMVGAVQEWGYISEFLCCGATI